MATTAFPTLPSTWAPASECVNDHAFWYVVVQSYTSALSTVTEEGIYFECMYGAPTPTSNLGGTFGNQPTGACIPPSYQTDVPYISDSDTCPTGYSFACGRATSYNGQLASAITCCQRSVIAMSPGGQGKTGTLAARHGTGLSPRKGKKCRWSVAQMNWC